jgi:SDR family mycofactocin-dependent oxidoreductase
MEEKYMGKHEGKVAVISGGARGQGRAHAIKLASEGADIVVFDICEQLPTVDVPMATLADLEETARLVRETGRRVIALRGDVRDSDSLAQVRDTALAEFGQIDIVVANAGIVSLGSAVSMSDAMWDEMIAVNLSGVFKTVRACLPPMIDSGRGGVAILTASTASFRAYDSHVHYTTAKHGVIGLMRSLAYELVSHNIRVNAVAPAAVATPLVQNEVMYNLFTGGREDATFDDVRAAFTGLNLMKEPWVQAEDVANAVSWLASDEARYITGVALPIDLGLLIK